MRRTILQAVLFMLLAAGVILIRPAPAMALSTTTVNTTAVADNPGDGKCDLYEALQAIADQNAGADMDGNGVGAYHECSVGPGPNAIVFAGPAAGGTIKLPLTLFNHPFSGLPFVVDDVTITGPVVIDGGGSAVNAHIFITNGGGQLTLDNMVVQNGYTTGGGGAILSLGPSDVVNIVNSSFHGNLAEVEGGAINAAGQLNIYGSNFSGNKALGTDGPTTDYQGHGGAIAISGYNSLNISLSNFAGNIATEGGGAIYTTADSGQISDSVFSGNIVNDDLVSSDTLGGGAIYNAGNDPETGLTLTRVALNGNLTFNAHGGAIYNASGGYLHTRDTSFNGNIAGDLSHVEYGGAIYNQETLDIRRTMFLGNVSSRGKGGAIFNDRTGEAYLASSTLTANGAPDNTNGEGGAIWNGNTQQGGPASQVFLYNVTFSINVSPNNGAAIFNETGGNHTVTLANTVIDGIPVVGGDVCNTALTSQGHNLEGSDTCGLDQPTDQPGGSPGLQTINYNGGPLTSLLSHALAPGSDAIDAGDDAVCSNQYVENLDQRSEPRPKPLQCDIGAYETDPLISAMASDPVPPGPIDIGNTSVGSPITNTLTVYAIGNVGLELSIPVDIALITGPDAGEFEMVTPMPVNTNGAYIIVLRCKALSVGQKLALLTMKTNVPDVPVVAYGLVCNVNPAPTASYASNPDIPGPLDFGEVQVGTPTAVVLHYFETGNATLNLGAAGLGGANAGDFALGAFDQTINNGDPSASLTVTCTPSAIGLRTATLAFTSNDPTQTNVNYNLVCEGIPAPPPPLAAPGSSILDGQGGANLLDGAYDVAVSPDGLNVYVTSFNDDSLTVFRRNAITGILTFVMSTTNLDMIGPQIVLVSPDGTQVYVTARTTDSFLIFNRNSSNGGVSVDTVWTQGDAGITGLDYPYGIAATADGRFVYVSSFASDAIVRFTRDSDGFVGFDDELIDHTNLSSAYQLALSPDGKNLYATGGSNSGTPNAGYITVYKRDSLDGTLTFLQRRIDGQSCGFFCSTPLSQAWGVDVSADGKNVYVVAHNDDSVVVFNRAFSGTLTYNSQVVDTAALLAAETPEAVEAPDTTAALGLTAVTDVKASPDGLFVYAAGTGENSLVVLARNPDTGRLTPVQNIAQNGSAPALGGARMVDVSTDGTSVYVAASSSDAVVGFHAANPVPSLTNLLPASAGAGSPALTVRVQGLNFVPGAVAQVNGADRETNYIHPQEVEVKLTAADLAAAGGRTFTVLNPEPGGGISTNSKLFSVTAPSDNPVPSIDELAPAGAIGGDPALTLTISGANFLASSTVKWNGVARAKTFINSGQLQINVTVQDMQSPGTAVVTVQNPGPGGGTSNAVGFDVAGPFENPVPSLISITPEFANAHGAASTPIKVRVQGAHFMQGTQGQWNGLDRPTQTINSTTIEITLLGSEVAFGGSGAVTVVNPGPGGGPSNALPFIIFPYTLQVPIVAR